MDDKGNAPLLETIDLKKYFKVGGGTLHAVDSINIKLYQGETLGVVGESGCGKSTLGRTILKLIEPTAGHIIYDGKDITSLNIRKMRPLRREMQIIFQDPYSSIDPRKSVIETISEYMFIHKSYPTRREIMNRAVELMDMVGLARRYADAYPHELDGGRRQRIGIARALSLQPRFIVCDEPVSALDMSIQAQILNLLMDLQDELNLSYMFVTHDLSVVKHISDQIMVMYLGTCIEFASSDELFQKPLLIQRPSWPLSRSLIWRVAKRVSSSFGVRYPARSTQNQAADLLAAASTAWRSALKRHRNMWRRNRVTLWLATW